MYFAYEICWIRFDYAGPGFQRMR